MQRIINLLEVFYNFGKVRCMIVSITSKPAAEQSTEGAKLLSGGGGQSLNLSTKAAVFQKVSLLIG